MEKLITMLLFGKKEMSKSSKIKKPSVKTRLRGRGVAELEGGEIQRSIAANRQLE